MTNCLTCQGYVKYMYSTKKLIRQYIAQYVAIKYRNISNSVQSGHLTFLQIKFDTVIISAFCVQRFSEVVL